MFAQACKGILDKETIAALTRLLLRPRCYSLLGGGHGPLGKLFGLGVDSELRTDLAKLASM